MVNSIVLGFVFHGAISLDTYLYIIIIIIILLQPQYQ